MTTEKWLIDSALRGWKFNVERADKLFGDLSAKQLEQEVAPGRNRLIYLWGHLAAVNDRLLPLLGIGERLHPEFDGMFISNPDKSVPLSVSERSLKTAWQEINKKLWEGFSKFSNSDWAQQLFQVRAWQQRHPGEECWFAYFAYPEINPETYGITCHHLPTADTGGLGGADNVPAVFDGTVIMSAGDLSGCEWPAASLNPYDAFRRAKPEETIDHAVMIYRGRFDLAQAAALSRAQNATEAVGKGDAARALALAEDAVAIDPSSILGHEARGDALAAMGRKEEARQEWDTALREARKIESGAQPMFVPDLESKLNK